MMFQNFPMWIQMEGMDGTTVWNDEERKAYIDKWEKRQIKKAEKARAASIPVPPPQKKILPIAQNYGKKSWRT